MDKRVGFIGLGDIGTPMARRILEGGYRVTSCAHRRREAIEMLKASGLVEAPNPNEVARQSDILITMVVNEPQTDAVLRGAAGGLAGLASGSTVVVMSTVSPNYCKALSLEAAKVGINVLDCPVSGGRPRAAEGSLALICGGEPAVVERCRPVLENMGRIIHCGPVGMGQVAKLANQGLTAAQFRLVQEVRAMAAAYGMDLDNLMDVVRSSTGASFIAENWSFLEPNWKHLGRMDKKDIDLCLAAGRDKEVDMPLVEAASQLTGPSS